MKSYVFRCYDYAKESRRRDRVGGSRSAAVSYIWMICVKIDYKGRY